MNDGERSKSLQSLITAELGKHAIWLSDLKERRADYDQSSPEKQKELSEWLQRETASHISSLITERLPALKSIIDGVHYLPAHSGRDHFDEFYDEFLEDALWCEIQREDNNITLVIVSIMNEHENEPFQTCLSPISKELANWILSSWKTICEIENICLAQVTVARKKLPANDNCKDVDFEKFYQEEWPLEN